MRDFFKENWILLFFEIVIIAIFCMFFGRFGDVMIDSFREAYIPSQIINGDILYKNIFCIYPSLGYLINGFCFKIFGVSLNVLYILNLLTTMGIFYYVYKISKMFFNNLLCFGVVLFLLSGFVLSPNVFNPFFPYSSGILYGLLFALSAVYFALNKKFPVAYFLCSLALCSKSEFILLLPALIYMSKKDLWFKNLMSFGLPIFIVLVILYLQGLRFSDFVTACTLIHLMGHTQTLNNFYFSMGLIPSFAHLPLYLINFIKFIVPINWNLYQEILIWAFPFILCLFVFRYKKLDISERFFIIAALLISLKVFFALTLQSYGVYFLPFALIAIGILLSNKFRKGFAVLLIVWALVIGFYNSKTLILKNYIIKSEYGTIKVSQAVGKDLTELVEYIKTIPSDSKVVVYPECLGVNFLTNRKSDNKFYSLIPLYVETFGEEIITKRLEKYPPDYIVISDYDTFAYGYKQFGKNYGAGILNYIKERYRLVKNINNGKYLIYSK